MLLCAAACSALIAPGGFCVGAVCHRAASTRPRCLLPLPCPAHPCPQVKRWTKNGAALSKVVSALLHFGQGLGLGPDADGLLNLGGAPEEEWREVAGTPNRRRLFDVEQLLGSGAPARLPARPPAPARSPVRPPACLPACSAGLLHTASAANHLPFTCRLCAGVCLQWRTSPLACLPWLPHLACCLSPSSTSWRAPSGC